VESRFFITDFGGTYITFKELLTGLYDVVLSAAPPGTEKVCTAFDKSPAVFRILSDDLYFGANTI
jgi:hypothetical protein